MKNKNFKMDQLMDEKSKNCLKNWIDLENALEELHMIRKHLKKQHQILDNFDRKIENLQNVDKADHERHLKTFYRIKYFKNAKLRDIYMAKRKRAEFDLDTYDFIYRGIRTKEDIQERINRLGEKQEYYDKKMEGYIGEWLGYYDGYEEIGTGIEFQIHPKYPRTDEEAGTNVYRRQDELQVIR